MGLVFFNSQLVHPFMVRETWVVTRGRLSGSWVIVRVVIRGRVSWPVDRENWQGREGERGGKKEVDRY
jgi:hypothetical protein